MEINGYQAGVVQDIRLINDGIRIAYSSPCRSTGISTSRYGYTGRR
ncbi:MAG: hypothetical protein MZV63_11425 [Marinilabiliales bacterium]|nr:hypothetical protein [Marinilabiliales bacterium]